MLGWCGLVVVRWLDEAILRDSQSHRSQGVFYPGFLKN
jgi:hypothetical protein